jgi:hypothetical protein
VFGLKVVELLVARGQFVLFPVEERLVPLNVGVFDAPGQGRVAPLPELVRVARLEVVVVANVQIVAGGDLFVPALVPDPALPGERLDVALTERELRELQADVSARQRLVVAGADVERLAPARPVLSVGDAGADALLDVVLVRLAVAPVEVVGGLQVDVGVERRRGVDFLAVRPPEAASRSYISARRAWVA